MGPAARDRPSRRICAGTITEFDVASRENDHVVRSPGEQRRSHRRRRQMAKARAVRDGEFERLSADVWPASGAATPDPDARRPDLLTTAVLAALDVALEAMRVPALIV